MTFEEAAGEDTRQLVHVSMGAFAVALPFLAWWQAVFLASAALAFNLFGIQKVLGVRVFRPGERLSRLTSGIVLYPLVIIGLLLVFPHRMDIVAAAWGVLAVGDGVATLIGRRVPLTPLSWNPRKSLGGSLAFFAFGGAAASFLAWWCSPAVVPPPYPWFPIVAGFTAAAAAAAVETIPVRLDDNVSVTAASAGVLWVLSLVSPDLVVEVLRTAGWLVPIAVFVNVLVAAAGFRAGTVTVSGTVVGALLGSTILISAGWRAWVLLLVTFACAVISSRMGLRRKLALGIAEEKGGRRGGGNAVANTGVAAIAALLATFSYAQDPALVALVAALAAGGSDTIASEIGKAWGRRTYLVTNRRRVPPGTPGAMSLEGTLAGVAGAAGLALLGVGLGLVTLAMTPLIVVAATAGALVESALGATLEPRGVLNNDLLNFVNTAVGAGVAVQLAGLAR